MPENPLSGKIQAFLLRTEELKEELKDFFAASAKETGEHRREKVKEFLTRYTALEQEAEELFGKFLEQNGLLVEHARHLIQKNSDAVAQNEQLIRILKQTKEELSALREEAEKLSAPPNSYGTFSAVNEDGTIDIYTGGRKMRVNLHPSIKADELRKGQELILNEVLNVIAVAKFETRGEVVTMKSRLDESRVQIVMRHDEEQIAEIGNALAGVSLKEGDHLRLDSRSGMLLEKLPKAETEDLLLEEVPDVGYEKVGGLGPQIEEIRDAIELPILYHDYFAEHKLEPPKGVLLYGPPGCGKTLVAKAIANSLAEQLSKQIGRPIKGYFLNVKGPELLNRYVGETERKIREIFSRAKEKAAEGSLVVVFFDEMDSMFRMRGSGISSDMESTIVPQFLAELDGVEGLKGVIVIGATNRQDLIDPAVLRPGRFDAKIKIDRPTYLGAQEILEVYCAPTLPIDLSHYADEKLYDKDGNYTPTDRNGNPRKFYDCEPMDGSRSDACLKIMKFAIRRDTKGLPRPEDVMKYFIQRTVLEIWGLTPDSKDWSRFVELTYSDGKQETMYFRHLISGAILESVVTRAKKFAVKRLIKTGRKGLVYSDVRDAVQKEYRENEDLPNTTTPAEWGRILGKQKGTIVNIRVFHREDTKQEEEKPVKAVSTGHIYL